MTTHVMRNTQTATVGAGAWNNDSLVFAGTSNLAGQTPFVTITGANSLASLTDSGAPGYGAIALMPGGALTTAALTVNHATLSISERPGTSVTFNGLSRVVNGSTLTATGYAGTGVYTVNGTLVIDGTSTVNMDYVAIAGSGTIRLSGAHALLRAGTVGAGETVKLDGGMLSLTNGMHFLGTITDSTPATSRIGDTATVAVYNAMDAVRETFDRTTGVMDLFDAAGTNLAHLTFAGHGDVYAATTSGLATNYIAITEHASAGMLPVSFTG